MHTTSKTEVLCLFGPTAVGKTEVLSQLQDRFSDFEVISADSVQVYKKLNIGSAKPTREDQKKLPHHLLDILEPDQQFSAGDFVSRADAAVKDVISRSRVPLITGGTAFYFVNYLFGLPGTPIADPEIRRRVEDLVETQGPEALHALLSQVDPLSHERLEMRDLYRRKRALEAFWGSGRPLSDFQVSREVRPGGNHDGRRFRKGGGQLVKPRSDPFLPRASLHRLSTVGPMDHGGALFPNFPGG